MKGSSRKKHGAGVLRSASVHFESPSHTSVLLKGLNALKNKGLLLDVTLIAGGHEFHAHRVVLASCSEYFRAMFTDAMMERSMAEIYLNGVTTEGMRYVPKYHTVAGVHCFYKNIFLD